ncbi:hypothetical protein ACQKP0_21225 [Heyndrickxia sp. NPDC080065]|uniref:hypothetical protein n=1 Tax=Heyndrickxia sp. NPDC080065 TaxID=3390568 RepID=UPI003D0346B9
MNILQKVYSYVSILTILLGFIVGLMYLIAVIIGGSGGEMIAIFSGKVMFWGIKLAAIAVLFGIINIYISKEHSLTIQADKKELKNIQRDSKDGISSSI